MVYRLDTPPWAEGPTSLGPATAHPYREEDLLCPVTPSKIVCVGRNYLAHAKELGNDAPTEPLLFLKPPSSLVGPNDRVVLPKASTRVEHEAELGVVIGKRARNVARENSIALAIGRVQRITCPIRR